MVFLASTDMKSNFRKPNDGMFKLMETHMKVDKNLSFYCGDAAGRKQAPFNDFSNDDLLFSIKLQIKFYTPEMLFKGEKQNFKAVKGVIVDESLEVEVAKDSAKDQADTDLKSVYKQISQSKVQEMIILVGSPGSGKSTFWRQYLKDLYHRVNNDDLGSSKKSESLCLEILKGAASVVVDNTNSKLENRATYIKMAQNEGIKQIRCLYFDVPKEKCMENNALRKVGVHMSKNVPGVCIHSFFKNHVKP